MEHEKLTVLVIEPLKKPYVKEIDAGLRSLQREIGGYIQAVYPWADPCAIVCDDEAKLNGSEWNRVLRDDDGHIYDIVAGTFLIVGLSSDNFTSLPEGYIRKYSKLFAVPEMFVRVNGTIMVAPVEDSDNDG